MTTALTLFAGRVTASTLTRTLAGPVIRYGVYGRTSRGRLKVAPGALRFPEDLGRVKLTREHKREESRGHLVALEDTGEGIRAALRVSDGPEGDAALQEAADRTRDGFSFDVIDAQIDGDTITSALVIAIGQVGIPAYDDMRIDTIAANQSGGPVMTPEQIERLAELRAQASRSPEEESEMLALAALEVATGNVTPPAPATAAAAPSPAAAATASVPAPQAAPAAQTVAASFQSPAPSGVPTRAPARTGQTGALAAFCQALADALGPGGGGAAAITAALNDVTHTQHTAHIEAPAWSGELWSGLQYESEFTPLLNAGTLTNWEGRGWRWVTKPQMQDYAGDKAAIATDTPVTEDSSYEAARMAVGHDIDRKFYDFPNAGFLQAYAEAVRESWAQKLDAKVRAFIVANAVAVTGPDGADPGTDPDPIVEANLLKAVARGVLALKRRKVGQATFVVVNDEDWFDLIDVTSNNKPAFMELFKIAPENWVTSDQVAAGSVLVGAKQTATVRTLPGSPIRVDAQRIANGGVDTGWFGYWAIEEHHTSGIAKVGYSG